MGFFPARSEDREGEKRKPIFGRSESVSRKLMLLEIVSLTLPCAVCHPRLSSLALTFLWHLLNLFATICPVFRLCPHRPYLTLYSSSFLFIMVHFPMLSKAAPIISSCNYGNLLLWWQILRIELLTLSLLIHSCVSGINPIPCEAVCVRERVIC